MVRLTTNKIFFYSFNDLPKLVKLCVDDVTTFFAEKANLKILYRILSSDLLSRYPRQETKLHRISSNCLVTQNQLATSPFISIFNLILLQLLPNFSQLKRIGLAAYNHIRAIPIEIRINHSHQPQIVKSANCYDQFSNGIDKKGIRLKSNYATCYNHVVSPI